MGSGGFHAGSGKGVGGGWDPGLISLTKRGPLQYGFSHFFQSNMTSAYF